MPRAKKGDIVRVHYAGTLSDGNTFETTFDTDPLEFKIGAKEVLHAFEQAIIGMEPGESKSFEIPAQKAYGTWHKDNVVTINRNELPKDLDAKRGNKLRLRHPNGNSMIVTVKDITATNVILDMNNPLAGEDLIFDVELVEIVT